MSFPTCKPPAVSAFAPIGKHFEIVQDDAPPQPKFNKDKFDSVLSQLKQINSDRIVASQLCQDEMARMGKERSQQTFNLKALRVMHRRNGKII